MKTKEHIIKYQYVCEHCGELSKHSISIIGEADGSIERLALGGAFFTQKIALGRLAKEIIRYRDETDAGNYGVFTGGRAYPKCGIHQSWCPPHDTTTTKPIQKIGLMVVGILLLWLIFMVIGLVLEYNKSNMGEYIITTLFIISAFGLVYGIYQVIKQVVENRNYFKNNKMLSKPEIFWNVYDDFWIDYRNKITW